MHGLAREVLVLWLQIVNQVGVVKAMWRLNFFRKITVIISKTVQDEDILTMED